MGCSIKVHGIEALRSKLESADKDFSEKKRRFMEELAKVGIQEAELKFSTAIYDGDFDVVVHSSPEWVDENTLFIVASGQSVTFVEFGTGTKTYTEQHPKAEELGFERGTYGKGNGQHKAWGYYGEPGSHGIGTAHQTKKGTVTVTRGNPPARAMYDAGKLMRERMAEIAKEVFGRD